MRCNSVAFLKNCLSFRELQLKCYNICMIYRKFYCCFVMKHMLVIFYICFGILVEVPSRGVVPIKCNIAFYIGIASPGIEWMNSSLTSHHHLGCIETRPQYKVSSERLRKWEYCSCDPWPRVYKKFHAQLSWPWNFSCSEMLKCQQLLAF